MNYTKKQLKIINKQANIYLKRNLFMRGIFKDHISKFFFFKENYFIYVDDKKGNHLYHICKPDSFYSNALNGNIFNSYDSYGIIYSYCYLVDLKKENKCKECNKPLSKVIINYFNLLKLSEKIR